MTGVLARPALCSMAIPLANPLPTWRSVTAGEPFMRAYPSAAPVTTSSCKHKMGRTLAVRPISETSCISEVPGFAKQVVTPASVRALKSDWAPFIVKPPGVGLIGYRHYRLLTIDESAALVVVDLDQRMSGLGQNRKSSMGAYVFRCSPNNGHRQETSACPFRAMSGSSGRGAERRRISLEPFIGPLVKEARRAFFMRQTVRSGRIKVGSAPLSGFGDVVSGAKLPRAA